MKNLPNLILIVVAVVLLVRIYGGSNGEFAAQDVLAQEIPAGMDIINHTQLQSRIQANQKPLLLLIYASWCPYCKKQMEALRTLQAKRSDVDILAISIDEKPQALDQYLASQPPLPFEHPLYVDKKSIRQLIASYGGTFGGGIPYMGIFVDGKMEASIGGYTSLEELESILSEL